MERPVGWAWPLPAGGGLKAENIFKSVGGLPWKAQPPEDMCCVEAGALVF